MRIAIRLGTALCLLALAGCQASALGRKDPPMPKPTACSLEHGQWELMPEFTDEFDGAALDEAKWHPRNPGWLGRQPGYFHTQNVTVSDGQLHITMKHEDLPDVPKGYHTYTCGAVKSKATVRYGYFEARCRAMKSRGSSAFWFYEGTPEVWTEIDVFEIGGGAPGHETTDHMNAHVFHTLVNPDRHWSTGGKWLSPTPLADAFHVYGLEWDKDVLVYYVDGAEVRRMPNTHWHQPLTLNFDSETMPDWFGLPALDTLPSTFSIDYIRAWRRLDGPQDPSPSAVTFQFFGERAKAAKNQPLTWRLKTVDGDLLVHARFGQGGEPSLVWLDCDDAYFAAKTAPRIEKTLIAKDTKGRSVAFTLWWDKAKDEKKHNGYRADHIAIAPEPRPAPGTSETYDFAAEDGETVQMKLE